jgi:hypothetical protein
MGGDFFTHTMARVVEYTEKSFRDTQMRISEQDQSLLISVFDNDGRKAVHIELAADDVLLLSQDLSAMYERMEDNRLSKSH